MTIIPLISSATSSFGYNYLNQGKDVVTGGNYTIDVNNTLYWQGYTPTSYIPYISSRFTSNLSVFGGNISTTGIFHAFASTTTITDFVKLTGTGAFAGSQPAITWYNSAGSLATARISSKAGSSYANSYFQIDVANSTKTLNERIAIDVGGTTFIRGDLNASKNINIAQNLYIAGNFSAKRPYGMYSSTQTQTIANPNVAYPISFNWTEDSYLITQSNDYSNFTFALSGDYLIEISAVFVTDTNNKHVEVWIQKNGVNIPRSNTKIEIPNSGIEFVVAVPFIIDMSAGDKMRLMYASDDAGSQLLYTTNTSYSPETPSIIMTISKISEIT